VVERFLFTTKQGKEMSVVVRGLIEGTKWYQTFDFDEFTVKGEAPSPAKWGMLQSELPHTLANRTVLDVACNQGYYSLRAAMLGAVVTGIDRDPVAVVTAQRIRDSVFGARNLKADFKVSEVGALPQLGQYDFTICFSLVHHVPLLETIQNIARATRQTAFIEALVDRSLSSDRPLFSLSDNPYVQEVLPSPLAFEQVLRRNFRGGVKILNPGSDRLMARCDK